MLLWAMLLGMAFNSAAAHPVLPVCVTVTDADSRLPLPGANVRVDDRGASTDLSGRACLMAEATHTLHVSFVGYTPYSAPLPPAWADTLHLAVSLELGAHTHGEVTVHSSRASRTFPAIPTRVEVVAGEELDEKLRMDPSNLRVILVESPGVVVQSASAASGSAGFRLQGLDTRHTQLLRDGFPVYDGLSGSLSLMQVPPLDLASVEIVKGPSSTLYGSGAVGGIVNLISRTPTDEPELSLLLNGTHTGKADLSAFGAARRGAWGLTTLASAHTQAAHDATGDGFTHAPSARRLTLAPTVFWYDEEGERLRVGGSWGGERRTGGFENALDLAGPDYAEQNVSDRQVGFLRYRHEIAHPLHLEVRSSVSRFHRTLRTPLHRFEATQLGRFAEATLTHSSEQRHTVLGADTRYDAFEDRAGTLSYAQTRTSLFAEHTWSIAPAVMIEGGLRADFSDGQTLWMPRTAALWRFGQGMHVRASFGTGFVAPSLQLDEMERQGYRNVAPLAAGLRPETSSGGMVDFSAGGVLTGEVTYTGNVAVHRTVVRNPLTAVQRGGLWTAERSDEDRTTYGIEAQIRLDAEPLKVFAGYVWLDAQEGNAPAPLTARHRTYTVLLLERHGAYRVGLEGYYTGAQHLPDGTRTTGYWVTGIMAERTFGHLRVFANAENFLNSVQAPLVAGSRANPTFLPLWMPLEGLVVNAGVVVRLGGHHEH